MAQIGAFRRGYPKLGVPNQIIAKLREKANPPPQDKQKVKEIEYHNKSNIAWVVYNVHLVQYEHSSGYSDITFIRTVGFLCSHTNKLPDSGVQ